MDVVFALIAVTILVLVTGAIARDYIELPPDDDSFLS
jgi:hypothetical protein